MAMSHTHAEPLDQAQVSQPGTRTGQGVAYGVGGVFRGRGQGKNRARGLLYSYSPLSPLSILFSPNPARDNCTDFVRFPRESEDVPRGGYRVCMR